MQLGRDDLALIGAERAITTAADGADELQWATAHGTYSWVLMSQARNTDAERVARNISEQIEPRMSTATAAQLTVWGGTLAPVWFRHQVAARNLVAEVCERRARLTPAMRDLVRSLGAH